MKFSTNVRFAFDAMESIIKIVPHWLATRALNPHLSRIKYRRGRKKARDIYLGQVSVSSRTFRIRTWHPLNAIFLLTIPRLFIPSLSHPSRNHSDFSYFLICFARSPPPSYPPPPSILVSFWFSLFVRSPGVFYSRCFVLGFNLLLF